MHVLCQRKDDGICSQCGEPLSPRLRRTCRARTPQADYDVFPAQPQLLGDRIEKALIAIGIPKERWAAFFAKHGEPPNCSGCDKRQEKINAAHQYLLDLTNEFGQKAADAVGQFWRILRPKPRPVFDNKAQT